MNEIVSPASVGFLKRCSRSSHREIAGNLFVSENTVKTHSSRLLDKLSARRRTQAVQLGKELGLISLEWQGRPARDSRAGCAWHWFTHPNG